MLFFIPHVKRYEQWQVNMELKQPKPNVEKKEKGISVSYKIKWLIFEWTYRYAQVLSKVNKH